MALVAESVIKTVGFAPGHIIIAHYDISFTSHQLVEPANDPGFYLLNGAVISQATFPILYTRFGSTFNTGGEGAGNFRLPDYTDGKSPIPKGLSSFTTFGAAGGEINHTLTTAELAVHTHVQNSHNHGVTDTHWHYVQNAGGQRITGADGSGNGPSHTDDSVWRNDGTSWDRTETASGGSIAVNSATPTNQNAGSGSSHNNMQPYIVIGGLLVKYG